MRMIVRSCILTVYGASLLASAGCGTSKAVRYYLLSVPDSQILASAEPAPGRTIRVGPTRVPAYLDRQQIVSRLNGNSVKIAQYDRWAEPLKLSVPRILLADMSTLLPGDQVLSHRSSEIHAFDYSVSIDIRRFDGVPGGTAELVAHWIIKGKDGRITPGRTDRPLTMPVSDDTYDALAQAESRLLAKLGQAIVTDINRLAGSSKD